ncbi:TetR/AcrR family transcriptional regulator [Oceanobacillus alkalisoli]|uniref:TetR/AcrR family transcriptional regulator n=1 Tax=Oceanobacillus alkalisoli TaxID=2925113 RepID=UPI001EF13D1F|nr:TetR/AcrR family transcriptional regulator [Oceanobacillus alkalisoli]MCF3943672.1 TetR/AcrR family transcriptional regulator [Oceanobacillus alkalisoli]MCG5104929.1 TetR/AcrR family transcriptional regulator [Oceanobacillus alkalisoli]
MNGFERRKALKKNNILEASLSLFLKNGISKVSVSEIAKVADVSQVTIYNYFESKDNLIGEVYRYYVHQVWEEYLRLFNSKIPFPEKVKTMIFDKTLVANQINEEFLEYFMKNYMQEDSYIMKFYTETALPQFLELIAEGKEQGYIDKSISDEAIMLYIQMFADHMRREDIASSLLPLTEDLTKLFFYGIFGKGME